MGRRAEWEIFLDKYKPEMEDDGQSIRQYEARNPEDWEVLKNTDNHFIWTLVDGDNGNTYFIPGYHLVNRIYHCICAVAWKKEEIDKEYKY